jgi:hypothetical protein
VWCRSQTASPLDWYWIPYRIFTETIKWKIVLWGSWLRPSGITSNLPFIYPRRLHGENIDFTNDNFTSLPLKNINLRELINERISEAITQTEDNENLYDCSYQTHVGLVARDHDCSYQTHVGLVARDHDCSHHTHVGLVARDHGEDWDKA